VIVEDGVAKLPDRSSFAGSVATSDRLVRTAVRLAGVPLYDAVRMMTFHARCDYRRRQGQRQHCS
jgi:N-acetylglucosamine-6-phosphate deacetylase